MHTAQIVACVLFTIAAVVAAFDKAWTLALIAAGLAVLQVPAI